MRRDAEISSGVLSHMRRHRDIYRAVLQNPHLSEGIRHTLTMVQGECDRLWGHLQGAAANRDRDPVEGAGATGADLADEAADVRGDGAPGAEREAS